MARRVCALLLLFCFSFLGCGKQEIEISTTTTTTTTITITTTSTSTTTSTIPTGSLEIKDGFYVLHLRGTPEAMGRQHGTLLKKQISDLIQGYVIEGLMPALGLSWEALVAVTQKYEAAMPSEFKEEMHGIAEGSGISYEAILIGQTVVDFVAVGSSSFIAKGKATSNETVVHGSNIEWADFNNTLRNHLTIIYYEPTNGNKFVSLSYAGGIGVLIGMNEKSIAMSITVIDAGADYNGLATTFNLRKALQYGSNLSEIEEYLTQSNRTRGYTVSVSGGNPKSMLVMELSPTHFKKREAGTQEVLVSTNHYLSSEMQPYQTASTSNNSLRRYNTLWESAIQNYGTITETLAKSFMSERSEPHGDYVNSNWVIYSSVLLPANLSFWVSKGPVTNEASYINFNL